MSPRAPDGGDLASALRRVGAHVVRAAGRDGLPPALSDLQRGINFKRDAATALTVDGAFGPRTRSALRRATADLGSGGGERLLERGRFHGFAEDAERDGPADLKDTLMAVFAGPGRTPARRVGALKRTLNGLGQVRFGGEAWRPLDDGEGRIGPERPRRPSPRSCAPPGRSCSPSASAASSESFKRDGRGRAGAKKTARPRASGRRRRDRF